MSDDVILCLCSGMTEAAAAAAIAAGARRPAAVHAACGAKVQCGGCAPRLRTLIAEGRPAPCWLTRPAADRAPHLPV